MKDLETKLGFLLCCQYFVVLFDNIGVKYYEIFFRNQIWINGMDQEIYTELWNVFIYKKYENAWQNEDSYSDNQGHF